MQKNITIPTNKDSVFISYHQLLNANNAFKEVKKQNQIINLNNQLINSQQIQIDNYILALNFCEQANDTLTQTVIPLLTKKSKDYRLLYEDFKKGYNKERTQKIALSISLPVAIIIGFVVGFLVH